MELDIGVILPEIKTMKPLVLIPNTIYLKDPREISKKLENFIRKQIEKLDKRGVIIGLSGGVDSLLVTLLCLRALEGTKKEVWLVYMPEKHSNPEHARDVIRIVKTLKPLGIKFMIKDITPLLEILGIYNLTLVKFLKLIPGKMLKGLTINSIVGLLETISGKNLITESRLGGKNKLIAEGNALVNAKHRVRLVMLRFLADLKNLATVGAANLTEYLTGVFVEDGIDHRSDIMPILVLFKSQVRELLRYIEMMPKDIIEKVSDTDVFPVPGFASKEKMFGKEETLDLILLGLVKGLSSVKIAKDLEIDLETVKEIEDLIEKSQHMRESPYIPKVR